MRTQNPATLSGNQYSPTLLAALGKGVGGYRCLAESCSGLGLYFLLPSWSKKGLLCWLWRSNSWDSYCLRCDDAPWQFLSGEFLSVERSQRGVFLLI